MQIKSSNSNNQNPFSQHLKIEKENIVCKDGFCSIPNNNDNSNVDKNNENLFDPI